MFIIEINHFDVKNIGKIYHLVKVFKVITLFNLTIADLTIFYFTLFYLTLYLVTSYSTSCPYTNENNDNLVKAIRYHDRLFS